MSPKLSKPIDSSRKRNQPLCFVLVKGEVLQGWDVALARMCLGQITEITVPYLYAYGEEGYPPVVPPRSTLLFRVELLNFTGGESRMMEFYFQILINYTL